MEINPLRGNLCTITDIALNRHGREILFATFLTSVVFLTIHDTSSFFVMVSNTVNTNVIYAQCSECQRGENFKQARANGRSNHDFLKGSQTC